MNQIHWDSPFVYMSLCIVLFLVIYFIINYKIRKYQFTKINEVGEQYSNYLEAQKLESEGSLPHKIIVPKDVDLKEVQIEVPLRVDLDTHEQVDTNHSNKVIKDSIETDDIDDYLNKLYKKTK